MSTKTDEEKQIEMSDSQNNTKCEKCFYKDGDIKVYYECCCEYDRLQVQKDDERARREGFIESNGRWIKKSKLIKDLKKSKLIIKELKKN